MNGRTFFWLGLAATVVWILLFDGHVFLPIIFGIGYQLVVGWLLLAGRVADEIGWPAVAGAAVGFAVFGWWLRARLRSTLRPQARRPKWAIVGMICLMIAMGSAGFGAAHQIAWLTNERNPVTKSRASRPSRLAYEAWYSAEAMDFHAETVHRELRDWYAEHSDRFHVLFLSGPDGKIAAAAVVIRNPTGIKPAERAWVCIDNAVSPMRLESLANVIAEYSRPQPADAAKGAP